MKDLIEIEKFFRQAPFDWAIGGGEAIDLFLGKTTREHKDVDLVVFWRDRNQIIDFMLNLGWRVFEFCGNGLVHELFNSDQPLIQRNLFCFSAANTNCQLASTADEDTYRFTFVPTEQDHFNYVEFLFNQRDEDNFLYHWNHAIKRSLNQALPQVNRVPILCPEIVLLYKSTYAESTDVASDHSRDFHVSLPCLSQAQKAWLKAALEIEHSERHQWVDQLSESPT